MSYDLGGGGGASFPFENVGDTVSGTITEVEEIQQTDLNTGAPAFWPDGKPKMQHRVTLQTDLADDSDDDGTRSVYLRGSRKPESKSTLAAVVAAVRATTGGTALDKGGLLTLRFVGEVPPQTRGHNPAKQYEATYRPPSADLGGQQAPQQATTAPPAAQQPLPVQQAPAPYAPAQQAAQQPQMANGTGPKGWLNGQPIMPAQYAGMVAAGVVPEQVPGWVSA